MDTNKQVHSFLHFTEQIGLLIILIATIIAVGQEVMVMINQMKVELKDLLLLFSNDCRPFCLYCNVVMT